MELDEWAKLQSENIATIEELYSSGLFLRLFKAVQKGNQTGDSKGYLGFLGDEFDSLDSTGHNKETAVIYASAFLVHSSLHHRNNNLPQKMINLPHLTRYHFTSFLQVFVDVPKSIIIREIICSKISEMCITEVLKRSSLPTKPNLVTPVANISSPATEGISGSRAQKKTLQNSSTKEISWGKKLKNYINKPTNFKVELTRKLDSAKKCIMKLECDMKKKNAEIFKLNSEIKKANEIILACKMHKTNDNLKATVENLMHQISELKETIMLFKNEKDRIFDEIYVQPKSLDQHANDLKIRELHPEIVNKEIEKTELKGNIHGDKITSLGKVIHEVQNGLNKTKKSNKEKNAIKTVQVKNLEEPLTANLDFTKNILASQKIKISPKREVIKQCAKHNNIKLTLQKDDIKKIIKNDKNDTSLLKKECLNRAEPMSDNSQKLEDLLAKTDNKKLKENYIAEKTKLIKELNSLKNEYENSKESVEKLDRELVNIKIIHSGCEERKVNGEHLMVELSQHIIKYKENEEAFKQDISEKNNKISNLNYEIGCLKKLVSSNEYENGILNTKLQAKETEIHKLQLSLVNLTKQFEATKGKFEEKIASKLLKIHDLDSTFGKFKNQYIQALNEKHLLTKEVENSKIIEYDLKLLQTNFQSLQEENTSIKQESVLRNEEILQLKSEIQALKTEIVNKNKILQDKTEMLKETKFKLKTLQDEKIDCKVKEKALIEQLDINKTTVVGLEQYIKLTDAKLNDAISEIGSLKDTVKEKDNQIEIFCKEKDRLELDIGILSKKNEMFSSLLDSKKNEIEEALNKLKQTQSEISTLTLKKAELEKNIKDLHITLHSQTNEISEKNNKIEVLQNDYKNTIQQLSEERAKNKYTLMHKMKRNKEEQESKLKSHISEAIYKDHINQLKCTHEKKVIALKSAMKKQFTEKLEALTFAIQNENTDLKDKLLREQGMCARLQLELKDVSGKLATAQEKNRTFLSNVPAKSTCRQLQLLSPISKAHSIEVLSGRSTGIYKFARDISPNWRSSDIKRCLPEGTPKKKPSSAVPRINVEGRVTKNLDRTQRSLSKQVKLLVQSHAVGEETSPPPDPPQDHIKSSQPSLSCGQFDPSRVSILQNRNRLCLPHLKSSYPVETQFISTVKEDDIKNNDKNHELH